MKPDSRNDPPAHPGDHPGDHRSERRNNATLAAVVDQAIRFDAERGAALAWAYLARHGVPPETILRVLTPRADGHMPRREPGRAIDGFPLHH